MNKREVQSRHSIDKAFKLGRLQRELILEGRLRHCLNKLGIIVKIEDLQIQATQPKLVCTHPFPTLRGCHVACTSILLDRRGPLISLNTCHLRGFL